DTIHTTSKAKFYGIRQLIFYDSLALAEEQRHLLYSTDSGHSWNAYRLEDICDQLQLQFPCFYNLSYDPNGTAYLISNEVYKIQVKANELSLIQIPINHQNINIKQVSDMGVNDFYVLGSKTDSSF